MSSSEITPISSSTQIPSNVFETLPNTIMTKIFNEAIEHLNDFATLNLVCKNFQRIMNIITSPEDFWKNLCFANEFLKVCDISWKENFLYYKSGKKNFLKQVRNCENETEKVKLKLEQLKKYYNYYDVVWLEEAINELKQACRNPKDLKDVEEIQYEYFLVLIDKNALDIAERYLESDLKNTCCEKQAKKDLEKAKN